jgi:hypothetical protein
VFKFLANQAYLRDGGHFQHVRYIMCIICGDVRPLNLPCVFVRFSVEHSVLQKTVVIINRC